MASETHVAKVAQEESYLAVCHIQAVKQRMHDFIMHLCFWSVDTDYMDGS